MAVVIPYVKQTHTVSGTWTAAKANVVEDGVNDAHYQPAVRVFHNAAQSITVSGTDQALAFNSERFDQAGNVASTMHDNVTNNSRLTCRHAGVYSIIGNASWAASPVGGAIRIRLNGATIIANHSGTGDYRRMAVATTYALAVNDYVELIVNQTSGGALNIDSAGNHSPEFMMHRVG